MANGTLTAITENGVNLLFEVTINGVKYVAIVSKAVFDALPTNVDKQNYVVAIISNNRRTSRQYENIYPALIGSALVIPD
jgi:hypothetical protein